MNPAIQAMLQSTLGFSGDKAARPWLRKGNITKADGDAYANLTTATAEAQAIKLKGEATAKAMLAQAEALRTNPVLVEMKKAEAWDGKLPVNVYAGAPIPFMNIGK